MWRYRPVASLYRITLFVSFCAAAGIVLGNMSSSHGHQTGAAKAFVSHDLTLTTDPTAVTWSHDGELLAASSNNGSQIDIWRKDGRHLQTLQRKGFGPYVGSSLAFLEAGRLLLTPPDSSTSQARDAVLTVWDLESERPARNVKGPISAPVGYAPNQAAAFAVSSDNSTAAVLTTGGDAYVALYSTSDWSPGLRFRARDFGLVASALALSHDGRLVAVGTADGRVAIFARDSSTPRLKFSVYDPKHLVLISAMAFSPDNAELAVGADATLRGEDQQSLIKVFRVSDGTLRKSLQPSNIRMVRNLTWDNRSPSIAFVADDDLVRIWDTSSDDPPFTERLSQPLAVSFAPQGNRLAVCHGKHIAILDLPAAVTQTEKPHE